MARVQSFVRIAALLALAAAGCGGGGNGDGPTATELVSRAASAFEDTESFHLVYDLGNAPAGGSGLRLTHAEGDVAVVDGKQEGIELQVAATFSGIPIETQLVVVGGDGLLRDPLTGVWRELDVTQVPGAFFDLLEGVPSVLRSLQQVERSGEEQADGVDAYRLRGKITARRLAAFLGNAPSGRLVPVELWVGRDDSLIRRIRVTGAVEPGEPDDVSRTVELSAFGKSVQVDRPVP